MYIFPAILGHNISGYLNVYSGYSIPEVSAAVQDRVKTTLENMTGLHVIRVGISIAGVNTDTGR